MATYFDDTFTGTLNTLLDAHSADTGGGYTKLGATAMTDALSGDGFVYRNAGGSPTGFYKSTTAIGAADYQVDLIFKVKSLLASDIIVAHGRIVDLNNYYEVDCSQAGLVSMRVKTTAGGLVTLASAPMSISAGQTHTISLRMVGSTLTLLWDGVVVTATIGSNPITDTNFASAGSTGLQVGFSTSTAQTSSTGLQADRLTAASVVPINTVAPVASGTRVVGQTLSTTDGTWDGSPSGYTYQWQRDGVNIASATSNTYVLVTADASHTVRCVVTATNAGGTASANSNGLAIIAEMIGTDVQFWTAAGSGLGGSPSVAIPTPTAVFDSVSHSEAQTGDIEYRVIYLKNTHAVRALGSTALWVTTQTTSPTTDIAIGLAPEGPGLDVTAIPNEQTPPVGVSFSAPSSEGTGIAVGSIPAGQAYGVWLRRTVLLNTDDLAVDSCTLGWSGTPT